MKKIFAVLLSASFLAAPLVAATEASAQDHRRPGVERDVHPNKYKWSRGHRMSPAERRNMRDVRDYRRYHLAPPPRGYRWVQVNNDYLMISIAGGVISNIITGR